MYFLEGLLYRYGRMGWPMGTDIMHGVQKLVTTLRLDRKMTFGDRLCKLWLLDETSFFLITTVPSIEVKQSDPEGLNINLPPHLWTSK